MKRFIKSKYIEEQGDGQFEEDSFALPRLDKMGLNLDNWDHVVALAGNPNTGKSTVFNKLTGLRQHTGNWPGKTVSRAEGGFNYGDRSYKLVDLPGTYSLLASSVEEEIARNFILFGQPDVTIVVADATRLQRNLNLVLQILEITDRAILCLNLMDEAERHGLEIDEEQLSADLSIPVVPTVARQGIGFDKLLQTVDKVARKEIQGKRYRVENEPEVVSKALDEVEQQILQQYPGLPNARWLALRLLDNDEKIVEAFENNEIERLRKLMDQQPLDLKKELEAINKEQRN